jgi:hypothetical protein
MVIDFEFDTKYGTFRDALVLPDDHIYTDAELETMKQTRLDNWIAIVEAPSVEWQMDDEGNQVLDENGNPIPVSV